MASGSERDPHGVDDNQLKLLMHANGTRDGLPKSPFAMPDNLIDELAKAPTSGDVNYEASLTPSTNPSRNSTRPHILTPSTSRLSLPLELALGSMERPDGAREARTLLPGVDLRHFNIALDEDEEGENEGIDSAGKGLCLSIYQKLGFLPLG